MAARRPGRPGARGPDDPKPPRAMVAALAMFLGALATGAADYSDTAPETTPLRVEALVREPTAPLVVEYGVMAFDGRPIGPVSLFAAADDVGTVGPITLTENASGAFTGIARFPEPALWTVTVTTARSTVSFAENLPWPHFATEAGSPKIKVDGSDPSREGSLNAIGDSPIFGHPSGIAPSLLVAAGIGILSALAAGVVLMRRSAGRRSGEETADASAGGGVAREP
jgi:hypothetical protein